MAAPDTTRITIRRAGDADLPFLQRALYEAVAWDPHRQLPPFALTIAHPELARYHEGWGRAGDLGVIAESGENVVGAALCRLFTETDHGHGFLDEHTPELAVAVWEGHRGQGIGGQLLALLEELAGGEGYERLSLSVDAANPARRLYLRAGYAEVTSDEGGVRMVKLLQLL